MKKIAVFLIVAAVALSGVGRISAQSAEDAKFQKLIEGYLDGLWKFYPTTSTLAGYTKYNDKIEDLSEGAIEKRHDSLDVINKDIVTKVDKTKLSPENQIAHSMLQEALDLEYIRFENILPWEYNPLFYNDIILNSVRGLLVKNGSPLEARIKSATERAKLLPGLIKKAKENLKTPAQVYTETAIAQLPGIIDFYKTEAPALVAASPAKNGFGAETAKVVAALEDYQRYLQTELLPKSTGNFRLGDAHTKLLRLMSQGSIPIQELVAKAKADFNNIRREMLIIAASFHKIMYPDIDIEKLQKPEEELKDYIIQNVFNKIQNDHPAAGELIDKIAASAASVKAFIGQKQLFELPAAELPIKPMPAADQGVQWSRLIAPGAYEADGSYTYEITPVPDSWPPEKAASFLGEYNNYFLPYLAIQRVFPGPFVPIFFTRKNTSLIPKLFPNQALLKGWPVYVEDLLIYEGYGNYDLRERLSQLKLMLKNVIDFTLELNIHEAGMTKEQAVSYMTRRGFQTPAEAERKWNHILLNPGEAAMAYIGYQEILELAAEAKKSKSAAFNQKEFIQKLLSFGAIPLREIKPKIAQ
jgi:uncharacterized protein (DUF885 family)